MGNISTYSSEVWWPCFVLKLEVQFGPDVARRKMLMGLVNHLAFCQFLEIS
ncbi:hypothetical protein OIU76_009143 [Salix suchowensis]|nr:hypothetical protein OIU76_009143 [Salix suchowensis]